MYNKAILPLLYLVKYLRAPHVIKYLCYLLIKNRTVIVPTRFDISNIVLDLNIGDFIEYWIFMDGLFEHEWVQLAKEYTQNKVFIDVGAYIGDYAFALYKDAQTIYAIEPEKKNYTKMLKYIKHTRITNVKAVKAALSSHKGKAQIFTSENKGWHSMVIPFRDGSEQVQAITLDDFVAENRIKNIGLIKIDVEGAEFEVLLGGLETLKRQHPVLQIEFNNPAANLTKHSLLELYDLLTQYDYAGYRLSNGTLEKIDRIYLEKIYFENLLFKRINK